MTLSPEVLSGLRERLAVATVPDREIDIDLWRAFEDGAEESFVAGRLPLPWLCLYTASIDAALALVERMLPDATWRVSNSMCKAEIWTDDDRFEGAHPASPPLAILLALLTALQENMK